MNHLKKFKNYDTLSESRLSDSLIAGMMTLLSSLNLSAQDRGQIENNLMGQISTITPNDIEKLQKISSLCYDLNTSKIKWSDLTPSQKRNIELVSLPLLTVDMDSVDKLIVTLLGDSRVDISLNEDRNLIEIETGNDIKKLSSGLKKTEGFVFDKLSLDLNSAKAILTSHVDLNMDFKIDTILHEPGVELHLSPTHFIPSINTIRLSDDITKTTLELENIKIFTVLGFWGKNLLPGTKSVGLHIRI